MAAVVPEPDPAAGATSEAPPAWSPGETGLVAAVLVVAAVLLFVRLDDRLLWQDEAETALLAESVLVHGMPTAFDGRNLISQEGQQEFAPPDYRWFWTPWLQHYAAALSFAVLGPTTFAARLPFVLFALGTLLLCHLLAREVARDTRVAGLAMGLLATSVPFLLHARQCRYYAPAAFFGCLLVWQYRRALHGRRRPMLWLAVAATGLFHSHYVVCAGFGLGLALHFVITDRNRERFRGFALAAAASGILALPYLIGFAARSSGQAFPGLTRTLSSLHAAVFHVDRYVFPLVLLLVPLAAWVVARRARDGAVDARAIPVEDTSHRASVLVLVGLASIALLVTIMPWFFFRYYVALIPIGAVLQALVVARVGRFRPSAAVVLAVVLLATDLLSRVVPIEQRIPARSVRHFRTGDEEAAVVVGAWARFLPMAAYLHEIGHDRTGPIEALVGHLEGRARPEETIIATYGDLPIQFYTDLRVVGGLSGEDPAPHVDAEWLFIRAHTHRSGDGRLKSFLSSHFDRERYALTRLGVPDVPYENRPDPTYHKFRDPEQGLPEARVWRRID